MPNKSFDVIKKKGAQMFGKPEWFELSKSGNVPIPVQRKGWLYYGGSLALILLPAVLLAGIQHFPELAIWLVLATTFFAFDVRQIRRAAMEKRALDSMHYISDADAVVETDRYSLEIKK